MIFQYSVIFGVTGTLTMTAFLYFLAFVTKRQYKVVKILGNMLTGKTTRDGGLSNAPIAIIVGLVVHYTIGILFAFIYLVLLKTGAIKPELIVSIAYGVAIGVIAVAGWFLFFTLNPCPPNIPLRGYLLNIFIGHIIFGFTLEISSYFLDS